jgi:hypothetical protein
VCVCVCTYIHMICIYYLYIGGKQFNVEEQWFRSMLTEIGQPFPQQVPHFDKKGKQVCVANVLLMCC